MSYASYLFPDLKSFDWKARTTLVVTALLIFGLLLSTAPQVSNVAFGAYGTGTTDADGNAHLGSNTVADTYAYNRANDSSSATQQQLGVDPNWANGVSRRSYALKYSTSSTYVAHTDIAAMDGASTLTVEGWVKFASFPIDFQGIFSKGTTYLHDIDLLTGGTSYGTSTGLFARVANGATDSFCHTSDADGFLVANQWYHLALVYDGGKSTNTEKVKVYVDGVSQALTCTAQAIPTTTYASNTGQFHVGRYQSDGSTYLSGIADEVRVSSVPRYTQTFAPRRRFVEDSSTIGLWHYDEGVSTTAYDSSTNGNTGTLNGSPPWVTGANAIMDGYDGSKGWQTTSGAGNVALSERSSVSDDSAYELKATGSNAIDLTGNYMKVDVANDTSNIAYQNLTQWTVEGWVRATNVTTLAYVWDHRNAGTASAPNPVVYIASGSICAWAYQSNLSTETSACGTITVNTWTHFAGIWDKTNAKIIMYVNGTLAQDSSWPTQDGRSEATKGGQYKSIGATFSGTDIVQGRIDEFRISNNIRYSANFTPSRRFANDSYTQLLMHMDEGTGSTTTDYSANSYDGVFNGTAAWAEGVYSASSTNTTSQNWAVPGYAYRQQLNVATTTAIGAGHGVETTVSRATPLNNKQTRADGKDWRVMYQPSDANRSLTFDGNQSNYVGVPTSSSLTFTNKATIEFWEYQSSLGGSAQTFISKWGNTQGTTYGGGWAVIAGGAAFDKLTFYMASSDSDGGNNYVQTGSVLTAGRWNHVAVVYDGTQSTNATKAKIYVNGVDQTISATAGTIPTTMFVPSGTAPADIRLGNWNGGNVGPLNGQLDEVRLSNVVRYTGNFSPARNPYVSDTTTAALWHLDEGSGTAIVDSSSSNQNNGTIGGSLTWATSGAITTTQEVPRFIPHGHALSFDGTSDYAVVGDSSSLDIGTGDFSFSSWVKTSTATNDSAYYRRIIAKRDNATGTGYELVLDTGIPKIYINSTLYAFSGASSIASGAWRHIAVSANRNNTAKLYVDGVQIGTANISAGTATVTNAVSLYLGIYNDLAGGYFSGQMDDVRVFSKALSVSEIAQIYGNTGYPLGSLAAHWPLDDGTGSSQSIDDVSTNDNNGTLGSNSVSPDSNDPTWIVNGGKVDSINQTQFKVVAPVGTSTTDKNYYLYYGNPNEGGSAQSYDTYGLALDGSDDYVSVPHSSSLGITGAITLSAWINPTTIAADGSYDGIITKADANSSKRAYALTLKPDGNLYFQISSDGSTNTALSSSGQTITTGSWWHVVAVYVPSTSMTLYINGTQRGETTSGVQASIHNPTDITLKLGAQSDLIASVMLNGKLDDARVYSRALSATEVTNLYTNTPSVSNTSLVGHWKLNDTTVAGTTASDSSSSSNPGTLTGFGFNTTSNWVTHNNLLAVATEPTLTSLITEQESPIFFEYRAASTSAWSTDRSKTFQLTTGEQQLGSTGVYVSFNPQGVYSKEDHYMISSWAIEPATTSGTEPARGKANAFPERANLVATGSGLDIIDAATNKLWMRFPAETNGIIAANAPEQVTAKNGRIYLASNDGLSEIQFDLDDAHRWIVSSSGNSSWGGLLADRDDASAYAAAAGEGINATATNDVSVTVILNKQYVAVASDDGMSLIQNSTQFDANNTDPAGTNILDYGNGALTDNFNDVAITSGGELYGSNATDSELDRFDNTHSDTADQTTVDASYTTTTTPAIKSGTVNDITVNEGTSDAEPGTSNTVAIAHNSGADVIHEHSTTASGFTRYYVRGGSAGSSNWSNATFGNAMEFDGNTVTPTELNDYVSMTRTQLPTAGGGLTIEAWINPYDQSSTSTTNCSTSICVARTIAGDSTGGAYWQFGLYGGQLQYAHYTGAAWERLTGSTTLSTNTWYHVAVSHNASTGAVKLFVNGVEDASGTHTYANTNVYINRIGMGYDQSAATAGDPFYGMIDEVRVSNSARYSAGFTVPTSEYTSDSSDTATKFLYHFNEQSGGTAYDAREVTSGRLDGTIGSGTTLDVRDPYLVSPALTGTIDKAVGVAMKKPTDTRSALLLSTNQIPFPSTVDDNMPAGATNLSVSTWVKWTGTPSATTTIVAYGGNDTSTGYYFIYDNTPAVKLTFGINHGASATSASSVFTPTAGLWYHIVGTYDHTNVKIYVNGLLYKASAQTADVDTATTFYISNEPNRSYHFNGTIDDTRVYARALSATEIARLYLDPYGVSDKDLKGWWKFQEGTSTAINDASRIANAAGTASGGTWTTDSPAVDKGTLWVAMDGAGADDGRLVGLNLNSERAVGSFTTANSGIPDNDLSSVSIGTNGSAVLIGTATAGAFAAPFGDFLIDDTAATPSTTVNKVRVKSGGTVRVKSGNGTVRIRPNPGG